MREAAADDLASDDVAVERRVADAAGAGRAGFSSHGSLPRQYRRAVLSIVLGFLLLGGACGVAGFLAWESDRATQELRASWQLHRAAQDLLNALLNAETGQRGFLLTRDPTYLRPYDDTVEHFSATMATLERNVAALPSADADHFRLVAAMKEVASQKLRELSNLTQLANSGQWDTAAAVLKTGDDTATMDRFRGLTRQLVDRVERNLEAVAARESQLTRLLLLTIAGAILCVIGLTIWLLRDTLWRLKLLESREVKLRRLAGSLEDRIAHRTRALAESNQRFDTALAASGVTAFTQDSDLVFTWVSNPASGLAPDSLVGRTDADILPAGDVGPMMALKRQVLDTGEPTRGEVRIVRDRERWFDMMIQPLATEQGAIMGIICGAIEITERKQQEAHIRLLMREVTHRSKNLLSVIEAILRQTANKSLSTNDFVARFSARVQSLAQSHDLLVDEDWQRASIFDIVRSQLSPYSDLQGPQIQLSGEAMYVRPDASQHIGMALHELATNATKYGALSVPEGRVQVQWGRSPDQATCFLSWREENGPEVQPPSKAGFGRVMIERAIARAVGGTVKLQYPPSGIEWTLTFPVGILI